MSTELLGNHFDIHGGGADLNFPHHENEIAQSEGCTGEKFVNYWMHNGFVRINDEKMSKSLGNFFTVREILEHFRAEEIRYFILTSHYRSPLNYDDEHLLNARQALTRFYTSLRGMPHAKPAGGEEYAEAFMQAMKDDFNTPEALAAMFELARQLNRAREDNSDRAAGLAAQLKYLGGILGILQEDPDAFLKGGASGGTLSDEEIDAMIQQRIQARADRNWAEADRIRDALDNQGIILEDSANETTWRRS
jgi:cysteinyl-tRNA synthetase